MWSRFFLVILGKVEGVVPMDCCLINCGELGNEFVVLISYELCRFMCVLKFN